MRGAHKAAQVAWGKLDNSSSLNVLSPAVIALVLYDSLFLMLPSARRANGNIKNKTGGT